MALPIDRRPTRPAGAVVGGAARRAHPGAAAARGALFKLRRAHAARDAGDVILAEAHGTVTDMTGESITVTYDPGQRNRLGRLSVLRAVWREGAATIAERVPDQ